MCLLLAVEGISEDRVSEGRQVSPELVSTAGFGPKIDRRDPGAVKGAGVFHGGIAARRSAAFNW
jgi:hypothetical protein